MSLLTSIQSDIMTAMKAGEKQTVETLRMLSSQIKYKQIEIQKDLTDEEVVTQIRKQVKELVEAREQFLAAGRQDLADANMVQITILGKYLPAEISDDELKKLITEFIEIHKDAFAANARALTGKVVGALRAKAAPERISKMYSTFVMQ